MSMQTINYCHAPRSWSWRNKQQGRSSKLLAAFCLAALLIVSENKKIKKKKRKARDVLI